MIKHHTYVIHIKCHTLKGDRYLLETASKAGRERSKFSVGLRCVGGEQANGCFSQERQGRAGVGRNYSDMQNFCVQGFVNFTS